MLSTIPAAALIPRQSSAQFWAQFRQLFRRQAPSSSNTERVVTTTHRRAPEIDLGDPAVAQVVHDIQNRLTVIVGSAEGICRLVPDGDADQDIAELRRCADQTLVLTRELLMAARPGLSARGRVNVNAVIVRAAGALSHVAGEMIRVTVRLSPEPATVVAEAMEVERILFNLALNALDAMPEGGELRVETAVEGAERGTASPRRVRLTVSDTGSGISDDIQARMFEPFFTTKEKGIGLGLSLVAFTVQELQGTVDVNSAPGTGTAITVRLPCVG